MQRQLEDGKTPFAQVGEVILPLGQKWSMPPYTGKHLKIVAAEPTTFDYQCNNAGVTTGNGVLVSGVTAGGGAPVATSVIDPVALDALLQPQSQDIINQVRVGLPWRSGLALYFKYLPSNYRGGLQQILTQTPDPLNLTTRYLAKYTDEDTPAHCPRMQVWFTYGKYPAFAIANQSGVHQKAILTFKIQKLRVEPITEEDFNAVVAGGVRWHEILAEDAMIL
jgi:hypothetical protein